MNRTSKTYWTITKVVIFMSLESKTRAEGGKTYLEKLQLNFCKIWKTNK